MKYLLEEHSRAIVPSVNQTSPGNLGNENFLIFLQEKIVDYSSSAGAGAAEPGQNGTAPQHWRRAARVYTVGGSNKTHSLCLYIN